MSPKVENGTESAVTTAPANSVESKSPKAKKPRAAKPKGKKAPAKPAPKAKKAAAKADAQYGVERDHDLPWSAKKVAVFKALKALKATGPTTAASAQRVAAKANVTARDVRHYSYHAKAAGLVGVADVEGERGYGFYLAAKGAKLDPAKALKEQQAAKE